MRLYWTLFRNRYDIVAEGIAFLPKRGIYPIFTSLVFEASCAAVRIGRKNTGRIGSMQIHDMGFIGREEMRKKNRPRLPDTHHPYLTHVIDITSPENRTAHESTYIFEPLGLYGNHEPKKPLLAADPINDMWAKNILRNKWANQNDILIGITFETTRQIKTWPRKNFVSIIRKGVRDGFKFVLLGLDKTYTDKVSTSFSTENVFNLTGQTSLGQMIAIIRQCDVFLSGDTGPSHVAQACRTPCVVLFGPSNEKEFGPADHHLHTLILPPASLQCRPCVLGPCVRGQSCMALIQPQEVYKQLKQKVETFTGRYQKRTAPMRQTPQRLLCAL